MIDQKHDRNGPGSTRSEVPHRIPESPVFEDRRFGGSESSGVLRNGVVTVGLVEVLERLIVP